MARDEINMRVGEEGMTKREFDRKYVGNTLAVNCKTFKEAVEFLKLAHDFGL